MFYVYVLQSTRRGNLYIGRTVDLERRLGEHNRGLNTATKVYRPWKLIYYEATLNERDTERRESYLKTNQGARLLKRRLKEYFYENK